MATGNSNKATNYQIEVIADRAVSISVEQSDREHEKRVNINTQLGEIDWRQTERTIEAIHIMVAAAASTPLDRVKSSQGLQMTKAEFRPRAQFSMPQASAEATEILEARLARAIHLFESGGFMDKEEVRKDPELIEAVQKARRLLKSTKLQSGFTLRLSSGRVIVMGDTLRGSDTVEVKEEIIIHVLCDGFKHSERVLHLTTAASVKCDFSFDEKKHWEKIKEICQQDWQELKVTGVKTTVDGKGATYTLTDLEMIGLPLGAATKALTSETPQNPEQ